jgi:hypothetical protein
VRVPRVGPSPCASKRSTGSPRVNRPDHRTTCPRVHRQVVDDVGPVVASLVPVTHQLRDDRVAIGLVVDQDSTATSLDPTMSVNSRVTNPRSSSRRRTIVGVCAADALRSTREGPLCQRGPSARSPSSSAKRSGTIGPIP